ncbi:MAG: VRR-NUC domain-containing protein [Oscillospiraceae bacterium]
MREKAIEAKLVKAVRIMGGLAPKFVSPGFDGVPDRLVLLPKGKIAFIELKARRQGAPAFADKAEAAVEALGFPVYRIDEPRAD